MRDDTALKVALALLVLVTVVSGGLGAWYLSEVGSDESPESLTRQVTDLGAGIVADEKEISQMELDVRGKNLSDVPRPTDRTRRQAIRYWNNAAVVTEPALAMVDTDEGVRLLMEQDCSKALREKAAEAKGLKEEIADLEFAAFVVDRDAQRQRAVLQTVQSSEKIHIDRVAKTQASEARIDRELRSAEHFGLDDLRGRREQLEAQYGARRSQLQALVDQSAAQLERVKQANATSEETKRRLRAELETALADTRDKLQDAAKREPAEVRAEHDGVILRSDTESRQATISIGTDQGVKLGMRFQVFQLRQGQRRFDKGFVVVRSAGRQTANCIIFSKEISLPRCPACGYTAALPEERFCAFCTGSEGGFHVQRLKASPKETVMGMSLEDPIVPGDLIENPLFSPGRRLRFAVKGDPLHPGYTADDLRFAVREHGGIAEPEVGAKTDVLLAGRWAGEDVRKATELGVRILRHHEVFDFVRK